MSVGGFQTLTGDEKISAKCRFFLAFLLLEAIIEPLSV
jgi:hypothetical protein